MQKGKLIEFEYIFKDGLLLEESCKTTFNTETLSIKGARTEIVWDYLKMENVRMTALFIVVDGIEYGSVTTTAEQLKNTACDPCRGDFMLFENVFELIFE